MRRVILAVTGTIAGLVALLAFRSHVPSAASAASAATGTSTGPAAGAGSGGAAAGPAGQPAASTSLAAGERAVDGNVANTAYGPVQVQVLVKQGKIAKINILEQPSSTARDLQIGQFAFPQLVSETLTAQSARIDAVSGASYTSAGYIKSLQSAIDNGALWIRRPAPSGRESNRESTGGCGCATPSR